MGWEKRGVCVPCCTEEGLRISGHLKITAATSLLGRRMVEKAKISSVSRS